MDCYYIYRDFAESCVSVILSTEELCEHRLGFDFTSKYDPVPADYFTRYAIKLEGQ